MVQLLYNKKMTGQVLSFSLAKKKKSAPKQQPQTTTEIFEDVYADIIDEWQTKAIANGLNEYIRKKIPVHARGTAQADFVGDLNILALAESRLGMQVSMINPEAAGTQGWLVSFKMGDEAFSAPPQMASEAYARAFNILMFVEFNSRLKRLKRL